MLVIADKENATGLAGIMGGEESEIMEGTRRVLFECAAFERANNRVTVPHAGHPHGSLRAALKRAYARQPPCRRWIAPACW